VLNPSIIDVQARINRMTGSYARAQGETQAVISGAVTPVTGRARKRLVGEVQTILNRLGEKRDAQVAGLITLAYVRGIHLVDPKDKLTASDKAAIATFQQSLRDQLRSAEQGIVRTFRDAVRRTTLQGAAMALQQSQNTGGALASMLQPASLVDRRGARWGILPYAEMALRTVSHEALTEGTLAGMKRHGLDLVNVSQTNGSTSSACEPFNGKTFSLSGDNPEYPQLTQVPPFHQSCEHFIYSAVLS
jgi:hypothetical protein